MNKNIEKEIKRYILPKLFRKLDLNKPHITFHNGDDNLILEVKNKRKHYVLRISPESHRSFEEVISELDLVNYLLSNGIPLAKLLPVSGNNFFLKLNYKNNKYVVCSFEWAKGRKIHPGDREPNIYDGRMHKNISEIFYNFGKYTAAMHNCLRNYKPLNSNFKRPDIAKILKRKYTVAEEDKHIYSTLKKLTERIKSIPKTAQNFGLVHFDLHSHNFHVHKNDLIFFDFADIQESFYMWDLARIFFYQMPFESISKKNLKFFYEKYKGFLKGYRTKRKLSDKDIEFMKLFFKLTEIRMYLSLKSSKVESGNMWAKNFLKNRKENIETNFIIFDAAK